MILTLFLTFARIGLFGFGGGYAMIPLIEAEVRLNGWLSVSQFADIVAVSQMTPGPIAVNAATFIGVRAAGIPGALAATVGLLAPSFVIITIAASMVEAFKHSRFLQSLLKVIRPVAIGLIGSAVLMFAEFSVFTGSLTEAGTRIDPVGLGIFFVILIVSVKWKVHPIACIVLSALLGIGLQLVL